MASAQRAAEDAFARIEQLEARIRELEGPLRRLHELALSDGLLHAGSGLDRDIEDALKGNHAD